MFFFFQAEDGIRDLVRSRGLGDVYKRQQLGGPRLAGQDDWYLIRQIRNYQTGARGFDPKDTFGAQMGAMAATLTNDKAVNDAVSYTHLTLPTSDLV